ncbi:hypothetical protein H0O02_04450 [Candidatus Micrarchaeota archaeon]|nr:hypothetical protein [Candidatus Micrarchaeota archaeon]
MKVKGIYIAAFAFIILAAISFAQQNTTALIQETTGAASLEIVKSWQLLAVFALVISSVIVALAYGLALGFEMPELKAWASTELNQIFANAVLVLILFVTIGFLDTIVALMVNTAAPGGLQCSVGQNCLEKVSVAYLSDYISAAEDGAKDVVKNNMKASAWVGRGIGIYATSIKLGQIGISMPLAANYILDVDRYHIVFEYYMGLLSSLYSQKFFVEQFCFKVAPVILALGIVARAFFFSRKTGGLLIAIAVGMMFFFPAMYLFDWMTLDMILAGDNAIVGEDLGCPAECMASSPIAYYGDTLLGDTSEIYDAFHDTEEESEIARQLATGEVESAVGTNGSAEGQVIYSCYYGDMQNCPAACRELPYPASIPQCADPTNQSACAQLPAKCKVVRLVPGGTAKPEYSECPQECKIVPPLNGDCSGFGHCLESRFDCRVAKKSDLSWRPTLDEHIAKEKRKKCTEYASDCPASLNAFESCVWVMPDSGSCDTLCPGCPSYCRIKNGNDANRASDCSEGERGTACASCSDTCKLDAADIIALDPEPPNCTACPVEKRISGAALPVELTTGDCSLDACPADYRLFTPKSACEECLLTPESYLYDPPINMECSDFCKPKDNTPMKDPSAYTKINEEGLVGMSEIQNVSKLMIPAYLLPLFNIVATLIFIRTFSGMIGGDIEIPGISKIF